MSQEPTPREMGYYLALASVGTEMVLPAVLGIFLDQYLETTPWITCVLAIVGFAGGLFHLLAILNQQNKQSDDSSEQKPSR